MKWTSSDWTFNPQELESKFSSKTKAIILNTPHNPIGKVSMSEPLCLARLGVAVLSCVE